MNLEICEDKATNELEIELSTEEIDKVVEMYLKNNLSNESYSVYCDTLKKQSSIQDAVFNAIFNEGVVDCLRHFIHKTTNTV